MIIDNRKWNNNTYHFKFYKGRIAYECDYKKLLLVFPGISPKRLKTSWPSDRKKDQGRIPYKYKVIFISNRQLQDLTFMPSIGYHLSTVRDILFGGKLGARYDGKGKGSSTSNSSWHSIKASYPDGVITPTRHRYSRKLKTWIYT